MTGSDEIQRQIYEAICAGNLNDTMKVVDTTPDILKENWNVSDSFLHLAALKGQDIVCEALIDAGIDVNIPGDGSATPISNAAAYGHLSTTKILLKRGAIVDGISTSISTPLINASIDGHLEIVKLLIDAGAEINREHLRLPQTALDFAVFYSVKNTRQLEVADLLRSHGAIRPYTEKHDWKDLPGRLYIEHIERAIGGFVNPLAVSQNKFRQGLITATYKARIPKKYDYQIVFTVGLASIGIELAICLPSAWPLNRASLQEPRFNWPIQMLNKLIAAQLDGLGLCHGDVLNLDHPALVGVEVSPGIKQWIVVLNQTIENEREGDARIPRTLLLVPVTTKLLQTKDQALIFADKKSQIKWEKLALSYTWQAVATTL